MEGVAESNNPRVELNASHGRLGTGWRNPNLDAVRAAPDFGDQATTFNLTVSVQLPNARRGALIMALADSLKSLNELDLADLNTENLGSWPLPVKIITGMLLFGLVFTGGYYLHIEALQLRLGGCSVNRR